MKVQGSKFKVQNCNSKFKVLLRVLFIYLTFNFALLTFNLDKAEASALSLSLDPPIIVINAIPPTNVANSLTIKNKGDTAITLQIQLKPFKPKGENARPPASSLAGEVGRGELEYSNEVLSIFKNIQILDAETPVDNITLGPKQQKNLNLNINIPKDTNISARPPATSSNQSQANQAGVAGEVGRDYYFSIIFISKNSSLTESNSSINQIGIATNVFLSVGQKETPKATIEEFSTNVFFEKGPVPFTIRIRNDGGQFIKPKGQIIIKNMFGQTVGKLDLTNVNVLSNSVRSIPASAWKENFLLGLYSATLNISVSDEGPTFTRAIRFLAIPLKILIIIVIILIAMIIIINRLKAYMNKSRT